MQAHLYEICSKPLGNGTKSQVYKIQEKKILLKISGTNNLEINDYLIHIKNANADLEPSSQFKADSSLLTFDFLNHGNVLDYISLKTLGKPISEIYTKFLCYKLLLGLKKIHENNISHNKIEIRNVMFDNNFNPIIIHFGDAIISENHQNDFFGLGIVLAGLISSKKIISYKFNKKENKYFFRFYSTNNHFHESSCEEAVFWRILESNKNIYVSKKFLNFFHILVSPDKIYNIDDLLNNEWLNEAKLYQNEIEKNFVEEFKNNYIFLSQSQKIINKLSDNLNSIIDNDEINESISSKILLDEFL